MGRPKGHRLTPEQRKRCRPKHLRGGRNPGPQPDADRRRHKPTIRRTEHARTPDERIHFKDALDTGQSVVDAESLRHPRFIFQLPTGEVHVDYLDEVLPCPNKATKKPNHGMSGPPKKPTSDS